MLDLYCLAVWELNVFKNFTQTDTNVYYLITSVNRPILRPIYIMDVNHFHYSQNNIFYLLKFLTDTLTVCQFGCLVETAWRLERYTSHVILQGGGKASCTYMRHMRQMTPARCGRQSVYWGSESRRSGSRQKYRESVAALKHVVPRWMLPLRREYRVHYSPLRTHLIDR